jgi:hypothetical protein
MDRSRLQGPLLEKYKAGLLPCGSAKGALLSQFGNVCGVAVLHGVEVTLFLWMVCTLLEISTGFHVKRMGLGGM